MKFINFFIQQSYRDFEVNFLVLRKYWAIFDIIVSITNAVQVNWPQKYIYLDLFLWNFVRPKTSDNLHICLYWSCLMYIYRGNDIKWLVYKTSAYSLTAKWSRVNSCIDEGREGCMDLTCLMTLMCVGISTSILGTSKH